MKKSLISTLCLFLIIGCKNQIPEATKSVGIEVLDALHEVQSRYKVGINYPKFSELVKEIQVKFDKLERQDKANDYKSKHYIKKALQIYLDMSELWDCSIKKNDVFGNVLKTECNYENLQNQYKIKVEDNDYYSFKKVLILLLNDAKLFIDKAEIYKNDLTIDSDFNLKSVNDTVERYNQPIATPTPHPVTNLNSSIHLNKSIGGISLGDSFDDKITNKIGLPNEKVKKGANTYTWGKTYEIEFFQPDLMVKVNPSNKIVAVSTTLTHFKTEKGAKIGTNLTELKKMYPNGESVYLFQPAYVTGLTMFLLDDSNRVNSISIDNNTF